MEFTDLILIFCVMGIVAMALAGGMTIVTLFALVTGNKQLLRDLNW